MYIGNNNTIETVFNLKHFNAIFVILHDNYLSKVLA